METVDLNVSLRQGTRKGSCRRIRAKGDIPAILYGAHRQNILLKVSARDFKKATEELKQIPFFQLLIETDGEVDKHLTIIKEIQRDPLSRRPRHLDFLELDTKTEATFEVSVRAFGAPVGVDKNGGEMLPIKTKVLVSCLPGDFVSSVDVDVSGLDIGDTLKISDVAFGAKIKVLDPPDSPLFSVHSQREEEVAPVGVGVKPAEPEVIKQKQPERKN